MLAVSSPLPAPTQVAVTVPLLIPAVAAFSLLLVTLNVPLPVVLAPNVPVVLAALVPLYVNVPLVPVNVPFVKLTVQFALATLYVNVLVEDFFVDVAGHVTVITLSPAFTGVNVIVPLFMLAVATAGVPLLTVGVALLEHVAVNVLFVPYVPFTIVDVPFVTVVLPSFTVVLPFTLLPLNVYVAVAALH